MTKVSSGEQRGFYQTVHSAQADLSFVVHTMISEGMCDHAEAKVLHIFYIRLSLESIRTKGYMIEIQRNLF